MVQVAGNAPDSGPTQRDAPADPSNSPRAPGSVLPYPFGYPFRVGRTYRCANHVYSLSATRSRSVLAGHERASGHDERRIDTGPLCFGDAESAWTTRS